jgi:hypothetical protein
MGDVIVHTFRDTIDIGDRKEKESRINFSLAQLRNNLTKRQGHGFISRSGSERNIKTRCGYQNDRKQQNPSQNARLNSMRGVKSNHASLY